MVSNVQSVTRKDASRCHFRFVLNRRAFGKWGLGLRIRLEGKARIELWGVGETEAELAINIESFLLCLGPVLFKEPHAAQNIPATWR